MPLRQWAWVSAAIQCSDGLHDTAANAHQHGTRMSSSDGLLDIAVHSYQYLMCTCSSSLQAPSKADARLAKDNKVIR